MKLPRISPNHKSVSMDPHKEQHSSMPRMFKRQNTILGGAKRRESMDASKFSDKRKLIPDNLSQVSTSYKHDYEFIKTLGDQEANKVDAATRH
jgi:hypothetical protein